MNCGRKPLNDCVFDPYNPAVAIRLGKTYIHGRAYEVYFCSVCKRRVLVRAKFVRAMTDDEAREFSQEVDELTKRLNG